MRRARWLAETSGRGGREKLDVVAILDDVFGVS